MKENPKEKNKIEKVEDPKVEIPTEKKTLAGFDMEDIEVKPWESDSMIRKEIIQILVKKPHALQWFRIHQELEKLVYLFHTKEDNESYIVTRNALPLLLGEAKPYRLYLGILLNGNVFFYPVQQPDETGHWNQWHESANRIALEARKKWVRAVPDRSINGYQCYIAEGKLDEPTWPEKTIIDYLEIAFRDRIINDSNHPEVKRLRGLTP